MVLGDSAALVHHRAGLRNPGLADGRGLTCALKHLIVKETSFAQGGQVEPGHDGPAVRLLASLGFFLAPHGRALSAMRVIRHISLERAAMNNAHASNRHLVETAERFLGHTIAVVVGFVLMIAGLGLGVTMVLLPIGLPLGLAGLLLCMWGLYWAAPTKQT
jgi:hypothetical protein